MIEDSRSQPLPVTITDATDVFLGEDHGCVLFPPYASCWGGPAATQSIAVGENAACELFLGQTVACWGEGSLGFLGDGSSTKRATPGPVPGLANVTQIDTSPHGSTICALDDQGVWCWGENLHGIALTAPSPVLTPKLVLPRCP